MSVLGYLRKAPRFFRSSVNAGRIRLSLANFRKIMNLRDIHKGRQCVVMLTGPSINNIDCSLLENHPFVCGVNGAFLKRSRFKYYFCSSLNFFGRNREAISAVDAELSIFSSAIPFVANPKSVYVILDYGARRRDNGMKEFRSNLLSKVSWGPTVLLDLVIPTCLWMGFSELVLLGADYTRNDFRHFYADSLHAERIDHEREVRAAHHGFDELLKYLEKKNHPMKIYNCSPQSSLWHFDKVPLEDILEPAHEGPRPGSDIRHDRPGL